MKAIESKEKRGREEEGREERWEVGRGGGGKDKSEEQCVGGGGGLRLTERREGRRNVKADIREGRETGRVLALRDDGR